MFIGTWMFASLLACLLHSSALRYVEPFDRTAWDQANAHWNEDRK